MLPISFYEQQGKTLLWLGLFFLSVGAWGFGENDLSIFAIRNPTFLYMLSFLGLYSVLIPLYIFFMRIIRFRYERVLKAILVLMTGAFMGIVLLQLLGLVMFSAAVYFFHGLLTTAMLFLAAMMTYEAVRMENAAARLMLLPALVLAGADLLEVASYYVGDLAMEPSAIFCTGAFVFFMVDSFAVGILFRREAEARRAYERQQKEAELISVRLEGVERRYEEIRSGEETLRRQRHDVKHHLAVMESYLDKGDTDGLRDYLGQLNTAFLPRMEEVYCANAAVNAIVSYYASQARQAGVVVEIGLNVPKEAGKITDAELSTVFGNLMENALEACMRMSSGKRKIRLCSDVIGSRLVVTLDNTYVGRLRRSGRGFASSKRPGPGIGVISIDTIVKRHGGNLKNSYGDGIFSASLYLSMKKEA